jgi:prevent-host-death family protein
MVWNGKVRMGKTLNLYEAKTRLSQLVEEAAAGEEIVIAKAGVPRARLVPLPPRRRPRRPGGSKGRIWIAADFDAPLPPEILDGFLGGGRR